MYFGVCLQKGHCGRRLAFLIIFPFVFVLAGRGAVPAAEAEYDASQAELILLPIAHLLQLVSNESGSPPDVICFWPTGILSTFPDNAHSSLIFFNCALEVLQGGIVNTPLAISAGDVFMGTTYDMEERNVT